MEGSSGLAPMAFATSARYSLGSPPCFVSVVTAPAAPAHPEELQTGTQGAAACSGAAQREVVTPACHKSHVSSSG